jgi:hypothetical protein
LTLLKNKKIKNIILLCVGASLIVSLILISDSSCGIRHIAIITDLKSYETSLDPEFCEELVQKIDSFNMQCTPHVEILDCG